MTCYESTAENSDGIAHALAHGTHLGTDATGADHYFSHPRRTIYVVDADGAVEHVEDLGGRDPAEWVQYVADARGWETAPRIGEDITAIFDGLDLEVDC